MIFYTSSASLVFADAIGASMTILSIHTKPGMLALREQYPLSQCLKESMKGGGATKRASSSIYSSCLPKRGENTLLT